MYSGLAFIYKAFMIWRISGARSVCVDIDYYLESHHYGIYTIFDERANIASRTIKHFLQVFKREGLSALLRAAAVVPLIVVVPRVVRHLRPRISPIHNNLNDQSKRGKDASRDVESCAARSLSEFIDTVLERLQETRLQLNHHEDSPCQEPYSKTTFGDIRQGVQTNLAMCEKRVGKDKHDYPTIKALLCTHNLDWEGASLYLYDLAKGLQENGVIAPLIMSPRKGPIALLYEKAGIPVEVCAQHISNKARYQDWLTFFSDFVQRSGVDAVLANTILNWHVVHACTQLGIPWLWNIHESEGPDKFFMRLPRDIIRIAYSALSLQGMTIYGSYGTAQVWESFPFYQPGTVIHNALNPDDFSQKASSYNRKAIRSSLDIDNDTLCLVMVGTISPRKGQQDLVDAIERLPKRTVTRMRCLIIGDWTHPYAVDLHRRITHGTESLRGAITCVDVTEDIHFYLSAADLAVCSSRSECFPRTVLEYMAYGLPIISTPRFGLSEQIFPEINGLVYEPGKVNDLTDHICNLFEDPELRLELGKNSRRVFQCVNQYEDMLKRYSSLFVGILETKRELHE